MSQKSYADLEADNKALTAEINRALLKLRSIALSLPVSASAIADVCQGLVAAFDSAGPKFDEEVK